MGASFPGHPFDCEPTPTWRETLGVLILAPVVLPLVWWLTWWRRWPS